MNTTALIEKPNATPHATVGWAPARLDVHHLPELDAWISEHAAGANGDLVLDCSAVEFIDQAAVDAILSAEHDPTRRLRVVRPSIAMQITFELLGQTMTAASVAA